MANANTVDEQYSVKKKASCQLNELHPGLKFDVVNFSGPLHCPVFEVSVTVNGQTFTGRGCSKKIAKEAAAESVLSVVNQWLQVDDQNAMVIEPPFEMPEQDSAAFDSAGDDYEKNHVMTLNEMFPNLEYKISDVSGPAHKRIFTVQVLFDNEVYEGKGSKIKIAKAAVAKAVLEDLTYKNEYYLTKFPKLFSEKIERMVQEKFAALVKNYPSFRRKGILAGIAMSKSENLSSVEIISVVYGDECNESENDHIVVLIRRCFLLYIYFQLELYLAGMTTENSVFEKRDSSEKVCLKDNVRFYLYISGTLCDDFSNDVVKQFSKVGIKVEPGMESHPQISDKDDILMKKNQMNRQSCWKRLSNWDFLGVQGDLLNNVLEPIFFYNVIFGSSLYSKYKLQSVCDNRKIDKNCPSEISFAESMDLSISVVWSQEMDNAEFIKCVKGNLELGKQSKMSHNNLFIRFLRISKYLRDNFDICKNRYFDFKAYDTDYESVNPAIFQS